MTAGQFIDAVLAVECDAAAMRAFFDAYVDFLLTTDIRPSVDGDEVLTVARDIARSGIGWCFGEGMDPACVRMWRETTGAEHPAGRIEEMSNEEIFQSGMRLGTESKGKLEG